MDRNNLLKTLALAADDVWGQLCEIRPALVRFNPPTIQLNGRFWRTAGLCFQEENRIELGVKFFAANGRYYGRMLRVILPHELIHQADWNLYGDSEKSCGHGAQWQKMMIEYGLPPNPYHTMDIAR